MTITASRFLARLLCSFTMAAVSLAGFRGLFAVAPNLDQRPGLFLMAAAGIMLAGGGAAFLTWKWFSSTQFARSAVTSRDEKYLNRKAHHDVRLAPHLSNALLAPYRATLEAQVWLSDDEFGAFVRRMLEMAADPGKRKYLPRLLLDTQIDYLEHPERLETCEHLRPVEKAMRQSGCKLEWASPGRVRHPGDISPFREGTPLPECVAWRTSNSYHKEGMMIHQSLECTPCGSMIFGTVVHEN